MKTKGRRQSINVEDRTHPMDWENLSKHARVQGRENTVQQLRKALIKQKNEIVQRPRKPLVNVRKDK